VGVLFRGEIFIKENVRAVSKRKELMVWHAGVAVEWVGLCVAMETTKSKEHQTFSL
jgi:hypothetical protein